MIRKFVLLVLALVAAGTAAWSYTGNDGRTRDAAQGPEIQNFEPNVKEGQKAPDFETTMVDGSRIRLSDLRGKIVLLNFWATWCSPCRAELSRVQTEIIDRFAGEEFVFLPISRGETKDTVLQFRETSGHMFPMGLDPDQSIFKLFADNYIPRNFLIDREGIIVMTEVGYSEEQFDELVGKIEEVLKSKR